MSLTLTFLWCPYFASVLCYNPSSLQTQIPSSEWDIQTSETPPIPLWRGGVWGALQTRWWVSPPIRELHLKRTEFDCIFTKCLNSRGLQKYLPQGVTVLCTVVIYSFFYNICAGFQTSHPKTCLCTFCIYLNVSHSLYNCFSSTFLLQYTKCFLFSFTNRGNVFQVRHSSICHWRRYSCQVSGNNLTCFHPPCGLLAKYIVIYVDGRTVFPLAKQFSLFVWHIVLFFLFSF